MQRKTYMMEQDFKCGDIKIFFGKVVDVKDTDKLLRVRVSIDGLTDEIAKDDLPWYFPWYGVNYLPEPETDVVSVIVFDGNFSTAFYGRKVNLSDISLGDDYEQYLEIFKRLINDKQVQLTYKISTGIEFINDTGKIQIETDKVSLFSDVNSIVITKDRIDIGNEAKQASLLGDDAVTELHAIVTHQSNIIAEMLKMFNAVSSGCVTPFTAPIKEALAPLIPAAQSKLKQENSKVDSDADKIQSKKVFIE